MSIRKPMLKNQGLCIQTLIYTIHLQINLKIVQWIYVCAQVHVHIHMYHGLSHRRWHGSVQLFLNDQHKWFIYSGQMHVLCISTLNPSHQCHLYSYMVHHMPSVEATAEQCTTMGFAQHHNWLSCLGIETTISRCKCNTNYWAMHPHYILTVTLVFLSW